MNEKTKDDKGDEDVHQQDNNLCWLLMKRRGKMFHLKHAMMTRATMIRTEDSGLLSKIEEED